MRTFDIKQDNGMNILNILSFQPFRNEHDQRIVNSQIPPIKSPIVQGAQTNPVGRIGPPFRTLAPRDDMPRI